MNMNWCPVCKTIMLLKVGRKYYKYKCFRCGYKVKVDKEAKT